MKKPTLEEVKEHFKNAKTVQCICMFDGGSVDITNNIETDIHEFNGGYWIDLESEHYLPKGVKLWGNGHWAKILTYKEPKVNILTLSEPIGDYVIFNGKKYVPEEEPKEESFVINREQIDILNKCSSTYKVTTYLETWFPKSFEPEKKEMVVGGWYVIDYDGLYSLFNFVKLDGNDLYAYGFNYKKEFLTEKIFCDISNHDTSKIREATHQEVEEALKAEAVRRYKVGDRIEFLDNYAYCQTEFNTIENIDFIVQGEPDVVFIRTNGWNLGLYKEGKWATIIQPKK